MPEQLVSVVIPCHGHARFLTECVDSLLAQTHSQWEAIIVNDGSPDDTRAVAHALVARDPRIRYVEQEHGGQASARNAGLRNARGRWIQFLDADDLIEPRKLEVQLAHLLPHAEVAVCYCAYWRGEALNARTRAIWTYVSCEFVLARPVYDVALRWEWAFSIPIHTPLFDARLFRELGVQFDQSLPTNEDWDMWMQVLRHTPTIIYIPEELAIYRLSEGSVTSDRTRMRQGFATAVHNQRKAQADDEGVVRCLDLTLRLIDHHYGHGPRARLWNWLDSNRAYRSRCPWPIQQFIARRLGPPPLPSDVYPAGPS